MIQFQENARKDGMTDRLYFIGPSSYRQGPNSMNTWIKQVDEEVHQNIHVY